MPVLEARKLCVGYKKPLVKDISFTVQASEWLVFTGENGTGKSTILKNLAGIHQQISGEVIRHLPDDKLSYISQLQSLNSYMPVTVREFISLGAFDETPRNTNTLMTEFGISELADRSFWELSGGQQRRCLLARALLTEPRLLILDEPFTGLDKDSLRDFVDILMAKKEQDNLSIILVTHFMDELLDKADAVYIVRGQQCIKDDDHA